MLARRVLASPCAGRAAVRVCASRGRARPSLPAPSYGANTKVALYSSLPLWLPPSILSEFNATGV